MMPTRCGFVAVVGRPNVGKSTLINSIMGSKISIVTHKPQTTRHRILAVHTSGDVQAVFVDTPGLHRKAGKAMNRLMNRTAVNALADADVALFVSDATHWTDEDDDVLKRLRSCDAPVIAVLNKIDLVRPKEQLLETLAAMAKRHDFAEIIPVSARKHDNLETLLELIPGYLPESPMLFPEDMRTDRSAEFHASEVIREKLTKLLHQELPYGLTVQIERYEQVDKRLREGDAAGQIHGPVEPGDHLGGSGKPEGYRRRQGRQYSQESGPVGPDRAQQATGTSCASGAMGQGQGELVR